MIAFSDPRHAPGRPADPDTVPSASPHREECPEPLPETTTATIGDEIARLSAHLNAATHQLLVLIREFDQREGWGNGFLSCAHWLSWRTGISPRPAREKVRVARALAPLHRIFEAMARGTLSYSKVRALTRVATPENEEDLLDVARHATGAQLEKLVRAWRKVERLNDAQEEERRHQRRFLRLHQDDDGSYLIQGRLDPEVGAVLEKALDWASEALYQENSEMAFQHRLADGLGLVAERALAAGEASGAEKASGAQKELGAEKASETQKVLPANSGQEEPRPVSRADRFQVVVHLDATELRSPAAAEVGGGSAEPWSSGRQFGETPPTAGGSAEPRRNAATPVSGIAAVSGGPGTLGLLPRETSRRLSCDAGLIVMSHNSGGGVTAVGRKTRTVPPSIRRALEVRDQGCRFPGCECRYTDAHHIKHWADGGETRLENLILLCRRHHRALHEGGFQVRVAPAEGEFLFVTPAGSVIPSVPAAPPILGDPVGEIVRTNTRAGVIPDAWTATPLWNGDPLDLGLAVEMFLGQNP